MLDKHTRKKKPDGDQEKHPRLKYTIRPHITQDQEPEPVEPLPATSGLLKRRDYRATGRMDPGNGKPK